MVEDISSDWNLLRGLPDFVYCANITPWCPATVWRLKVLGRDNSTWLVQRDKLLWWAGDYLNAHMEVDLKPMHLKVANVCETLTQVVMKMTESRDWVMEHYEDCIANRESRLRGDIIEDTLYPDDGGSPEIEEVYGALEERDSLRLELWHLKRGLASWENLNLDFAATP